MSGYLAKGAGRGAWGMQKHDRRFWWAPFLFSLVVHFFFSSVTEANWSPQWQLVPAALRPAQGRWPVPSWSSHDPPPLALLHPVISVEVVVVVLPQAPSQQRQGAALATRLP